MKYLIPKGTEVELFVYDETEFSNEGIKIKLDYDVYLISNADMVALTFRDTRKLFTYRLYEKTGLVQFAVDIENIIMYD